jgi:hypothetical protein
MRKNFEPSRADGRSDAQVILDLCGDVAPDTAFTHGQIIEALEAGLDKRVTRQRVYAAVAAGNKRLLKQKQRYLRVVRGVGYRVIRADEHLDTALSKTDSAEAMYRKGLAILKDARMDELTPTQKALHEGQFMLLGAVYRQMRDVHNRQKRHDGVLAELKARVDKLERGFE